MIELKTKKFESEFVSKLLFYVNAVNRIIKAPEDNPTIGILLCKDKDDVVVDFSLEGINRPLGVGTLKYTELADDIKDVLPSVEELQEELKKFNPNKDK